MCVYMGVRKFGPFICQNQKIGPFIGVTIVSKKTIAIVLTLQDVPLRYYYYCGLPLQYYCDTIV